MENSIKDQNTEPEKTAEQKDQPSAQNKETAELQAKDNNGQTEPTTEKTSNVGQGPSVENL